MEETNGAVRALIDRRISTADLQARYGLKSRTTLINRMQALEIRAYREGRTVYVEESSIQALDELHEYLKSHPTSTLDTAVSMVRGEKSAILPQSAPQNNNDFVSLVVAIADALAPQKDPLHQLAALETAAERGWLLTSHQVQLLAGVRPKGRNMKRGSFIFIRSGKIGASSAWKIENTRD